MLLLEHLQLTWFYLKSKGLWHDQRQGTKHYLVTGPLEVKRRLTINTLTKWMLRHPHRVDLSFLSDQELGLRNRWGTPMGPQLANGTGHHWENRGRHRREGWSRPALTNWVAPSLLKLNPFKWKQLKLQFLIQATFQGPTSHMWLVTTNLDDTDSEHCITAQCFVGEHWSRLL